MGLSPNLKSFKMPMSKTVSKAKKFSLPNRKVTVRYVKRQTGYITNPRHVAYGGKLEGSVDSLRPRMSSNGKYVPVLTEPEQTFLEKALAMEPGDLSVYKSEDNFWDDIVVNLGKDSTVLDLSEPYDYIITKSY